MPEFPSPSAAELRGALQNAIGCAEIALATPPAQLFHAAGEALDALNEAVDMIDEARLQVFEVSCAEERELTDLVHCVQALIVLLLREVERPLNRTGRSARRSAPARPSWDLN